MSDPQLFQGKVLADLSKDEAQSEVAARQKAVDDITSGIIIGDPSTKDAVLQGLRDDVTALNAHIVALG